MYKTTFTYDKSSNPPKSSWGDDGRINVLIFPDINAFKSFLDGLGIATAFIGGAVGYRGTPGIPGTQLAGVVGTYVRLAGLITLNILWDKYTIAHDNGLKKGNSVTFSTNQDKFYVTLFGNESWYNYYQKEMTAGGTHTIFVNDKKEGSIK